MKIDEKKAWSLWEVTMEWLLKGKGETYQPWIANVAAPDAEAAVRAVREDLQSDKAFKAVRLAKVVRLSSIDMFAKAPQRRRR